MAQTGFQHSLLLMSMMLAVVLAEIAQSPSNPNPTANDDGCWKSNPNDPDVIEAGKLAIKLYNNLVKSDEKLKFVAVIKGEEQAEEGTFYNLLIQARNRTRVSGYYQAHLFLTLDFFKELSSPSDFVSSCGFDN